MYNDKLVQNIINSMFLHLDGNPDLRQNIADHIELFMTREQREILEAFFNQGLYAELIELYNYSYRLIEPKVESV